MRIVELNEQTKTNLLEDLLKRSPNQYTQYENTVSEIIARVKTEKDAAIFDYTKQFDKVEITAETIRVTEAEIEDAYTRVDPDVLAVIRKAIKNIEEYHMLQKRNS